MLMQSNDRRTLYWQLKITGVYHYLSMIVLFYDDTLWIWILDLEKGPGVEWPIISK